MGQVAPAYPDDSPQAQGAFSRAGELAASGNVGEACRVLQGLLETDAERVIPSEADASLYVPLRARIHDLLLASPALSARYREVEEPVARDLLAGGRVAEVERSRWLTPSGLDAALRVADAHVGAGRFEAARYTLEALARHPDAGGSDAMRRVAGLARRVAAYIPRPDVREWALGLSASAGISDPLEQPLRRPPGAAPAGISLLDSGVFSLGSGAVPPEPLQSEWITPRIGAQSADPGLEQVEDETFDPAERPVDLPFLIPAAAGDLAVVGDGLTVRGIDRYTLAEQWTSTAIDLPFREYGDDASDDAVPTLVFRGLGSALEDSVAPAIAGGVVIAPVGLASNRRSIDTDRIRGLDLRTGREIWNIALPEVGSGNDGTGLRGSIVAEGDVAVVGLRRLGQVRRLVSVALAGISIRDGSVLWTRTLGSAGSTPRGYNRRAADGSALFRGVVYRSDEIGILAAIEVATGRPVWVRTLPGADITQIESAGTFTSSIPVVREDQVIVLSPDAKKLHRFERASGKALGERSLTFIDEPTYAVDVGRWIAIISRTRVAFVPIDSPDTAAPVLFDWIDPSRIPAGSRMIGRAFAADGKLVIPATTGLAVIDPADPARPAMIPLNHSGNVLAIDGDLLVADAARLHSYVSWDRAESIVRRRMEESAADPGPALAYARLAYRGERHDLVVQAVESALKALIADPNSEEAQRVRPRLTGALQEMVRDGLSSLSPSLTPASLGSAPDPTPPIRDVAILRQLLDQLQRLASSDQERLTATLFDGALSEISGATGRAIDAYQEILASPALCSATWDAGSVSVSGEVAATERLVMLVKAGGAAVYAAYDEEAARLRREGLGRDELLELARRYPAAWQNVEIFSGLALRAQASGDPADAAELLGRALSAAEIAQQSGRPGAAAQISALTGRLADLLEARERFAAAAQLVNRITSQYPSISIGDPPRDVAALISRWNEALAKIKRLPRIGRRLGDQVGVLAGWQILPQQIERPRPPGAEQTVLYSPLEGLLGVYSVNASGSLVQTWSRRVDGPPTLLWRDDRSMLVFFTSREGNRVERIDTISGTSLWTTPSFESIFGGSAQAPTSARGGQFPTPLDGMVSFRDFLIELDDETMVLAQRGGRAAGFDLATGKTLWSTPDVVSRVYDLAVEGAYAVFAGARESAVPGAANAEQRTPALEVLDARTGKPLLKPDTQGEHVHFVRLSGDGTLVFAQGQRMTAYQLRTGALLWRSAEPGVVDAIDAWILDESLYVMNRVGELHSAPLATGAFGTPISTSNRLSADTGPAIAFRENARSVFLADNGIVILGDDDRTVGLDPLGAITPMVRPVRGEGVLVGVDAQRQSVHSAEVARVMIFDARTGKLLTQRSIEVPDDPSRIALVDGRILFTAGNSTFVVPADQDRDPSETPFAHDKVAPAGQKPAE